jgi:hypothetical protein
LTKKRVGKMHCNDSTTLIQLAKSWNNLDISCVERELAENCIYESQWVLRPIVGKRALLTYLNSKFDAIKTAMQSQLMTVTAELAFHPSLKKRPCIILTQKTSEGIRQVTVLMETKKGKISRIDVCFIPDPIEAVLTGKYPK